MGMLYSQLFVKIKEPEKSFAGNTIIVTGSNTGLGKEAARHFARLGASKLILAVRNTKAGEDAKKDIETTTGCAASVIEVWRLDLSSYESVKEFAIRASNLPRIDVLLENAGVAGYEYHLAEHHERTITINVISTYLLALLLLPKLKATAKEFKTEPRLNIVSSETHKMTKFPEWKKSDIFAALDDEPNTNMKERYPTSKLLEVLVNRQLAPKMKGSGVILNCLNPGLCHSELSREMDNVAISIFKFLFARTTEMGSRTLLAASEAGQESHGKYMSDGKVKDHDLSSFVKSADGNKAGEKVWVQLSGILEKIEPGVTRNI